MSEAGIRTVGQPAEPIEPTNSSVPLLGRRAVTMVLLVLALAGVTGTVVFGLMWAQLQGRQNAEASARATAALFVRDFTNFDPGTVERTFAALRSMGTGQFASQARTEFSPRLRQALEAAQASSRGQVRYLYVQSFTGSRASFYADVSQTYASNKTNGPRADELRLVIDLVRLEGRWRVAAATSLGTGSTLGG